MVTPVLALDGARGIGEHLPAAALNLELHEGDFAMIEKSPGLGVARVLPICAVAWCPWPAAPCGSSAVTGAGCRTVTRMRCVGRPWP